jgi:hypothetical protein
MSDKIVVNDNFLNIYELEKCHKLINSKQWNYNHYSVPLGEMYDTPFWSMDLMNESFFNTYILNIIEKTFFKKFKIIRLYVNGQTFGQNGSFHTDSCEPNTYTFCLYLTNISKDLVDTAGGYIYFKIPDEKYKTCYEPIYNRGILFPSNISHMASHFTRFIMKMRVCVSWKLEEIVE